MFPLLVIFIHLPIIKKDKIIDLESYMSFFFYFIEKVFSWKEIIIPMLSVSFESSLIWYSERGQTSIFITHSKCHFHAAISFTSYFSTLHVKKKNQE